MSTKRDRSRFIPEPVSVWLGQGEYVKEYKVVPAAWSSLYSLKSVLRSLLEDVTALWNSEILTSVKAAVSDSSDENGSKMLQSILVNDGLWALVDKIIEKPYEIFSLAIPDLDSNLFSQDNPNGATIPQVWETFKVIAEVNQLEIAKNLLTGKGLTN